MPTKQQKKTEKQSKQVTPEDINVSPGSPPQVETFAYPADTG
jgi:hypothetical protein